FFSRRRRHTRFSRDWSSDVCSSDLLRVLELLEAMPPYQGGGGQIRAVFKDRTEYAELPAKFEAGTPAIAETIGLGAAVDYVRGRSEERRVGEECGAGWWRYMLEVSR